MLSLQNYFSLYHISYVIFLLLLEWSLIQQFAQTAECCSGISGLGFKHISKVLVMHTS